MSSSAGAWLDAALFTLAIAASIAGTKPPAYANKSAKARAGKSGGDVISRLYLASDAVVYAFHGILVALAVAHICGTWQALRLPTSSSTFWARLNQARMDVLGKATGSAAYTLRANTLGWLRDGAASPSMPRFFTSRLAFRAACLSTVAGGWARVACFRQLGRFFTFALAVHDGHKVIDTGLYGRVRHPAYTAILLLAASLGYAIAVGPLLPSSFRVAALVTLVTSTGGTLFLVRMRIRDEESMLISELGQAYKQYMKKVPDRLLPGIY